MGGNREHIIFGIYPIQEAVSANVTIDKLFVQKENSNSVIEAIINDLENKDTSISYVPVEKLNRLSRGNHQGIVAVSSPVSFISLEDLVENTLSKQKTPLFIILDQISDVRNFGAIIRTAECTGVDGIIIQKKGGAPLSGDTVKTSAGAVFNVPICKVDHIKDAIFYLKASNIQTLAATEKSKDTIYDIDLNVPMALILGSEGKGISRSILNLVDLKASLPLAGKIGSLNVSVACGAILYEIIRQRRS